MPVQIPFMIATAAGKVATSQLMRQAVTMGTKKFIQTHGAAALTALGFTSLSQDTPKNQEPLKYIPTIHGGEELPKIEQETFPVQEDWKGSFGENEGLKIPEPSEQSKGLEIPPQEKKVPPGFSKPDSPDTTILTKDIAEQTKELVPEKPEFGKLTEVEKQTAIALKGDKPDYYSRIARAVEGSQEIATAKQWMGIIQGQGATEAELDYLGLTEFLKGKEKITKENLLKHIKEKDISSKITTTKMPDKDREVVEYEHFRLKGTNTDSFETYVMQFGVTKDEEGKYLEHDEPITYRADATHIGKEQYGRNTFLTLRTQIGYSPSFSIAQVLAPNKYFETTGKSIEYNKWATEIGKLFENTLIGDEIQSDLIQRGRTTGFEKDFDVIKGSELISYLDTNNIKYEIEETDTQPLIRLYHSRLISEDDLEDERNFTLKSFTPNSIYIFGHPIKLKAVGEGEAASFIRYDDQRIDRTKPKEFKKRVTPNFWTGKLSDHIEVLPNFPITSDTKVAELGIMELIRIAVKNGNDSIAIPSGQILADRYRGRENLKVWQDKILLGVLQKIAKRNNTTVTEHVIQKKKEFTKESGLHVEGTVDWMNEAKEQGYSLRKISREELRKLLMTDGDRPSDRTYVGQEIPDFTSMFTNNQYSRRVESIAEELTLPETANVPVTNNTFYVWQNADGLIKFELPIVGGNDAEEYMDDEGRDVDTSAYVEGLSKDFTERTYLEYLLNKIEEYQGKAEGTREDHKLYKMKIPKSLQKKILSEPQKFTKLDKQKSPIDGQTQKALA